MDQYHLFIYLVPFALLLSAGVLFFSWRRRKRLLARTLAMMMVPVLGYLITNSLELLDPTEAGTLFWARCGYFFAPYIPLMWLVFALDYTGRHKWLRLRYFWPLLVVPVFTTIFAWTNDLHHLIWTSTIFTPRSGFLALSVKYGYWFWINAIYLYFTLIMGTFLVVREYILYFRTYRRQSFWVLVGDGGAVDRPLHLCISSRSRLAKGLFAD